MTSEKEKEVAVLMASLKSVTDQIAELNNSKRNIEQEIAGLICPFQVGDRVKAVSSGAAYEVRGIQYYGWLSKPDYRMIGKKIKKNGEPSQHVQQMYGEYEKVEK